MLSQPGIFHLDFPCRISYNKKYGYEQPYFHAGVVELADTPDLGSGGRPCRFKSCHPYQQKATNLVSARFVAFCFIFKIYFDCYMKRKDTFMKHCGTQTLETDRLILRRYVNKDADAMYKNWASDKEVTKFLTWPAHSSREVSQGVVEDWVNQYFKENYYHWAIVLKDLGDEPIGDIAVVGMKEEISMAHIGYCIGRAWWYKGITSEALKAVMDFLFDIVDVHRVEAKHDRRNPNSGKVMEKCGMKYEGTLRSSDWNNQGICDVCYYALLKSER